MGFGHRVYKNYDPRAKIIKKACDDVFEVTGVNPLLEIAQELEKIALEDEYFVKRKLYPNVDFYSGLIYEAFQFPPEMFTVLFAIGRTPGWLAQWLGAGAGQGAEDRPPQADLHRRPHPRLRAGLRALGLSGARQRTADGGRAAARLSRGAVTRVSRPGEMTDATQRLGRAGRASGRLRPGQRPDRLAAVRRDRGRGRARRGPAVPRRRRLRLHGLQPRPGLAARTGTTPRPRCARTPPALARARAGLPDPLPRLPGRRGAGHRWTSSATLHAAGVPLWGLTNWSHELFPHGRAALRVPRAARGRGRVGHRGRGQAGPARSSRSSRRRTGLPLDRLVFVDDRADNVAAAAAAGMDALLFTDAGEPARGTCATAACRSDRACPIGSGRQSSARR